LLPALFLGALCALFLVTVCCLFVCANMRNTALPPSPVGIENVLDMLAKSPYDFPLFVVDVQHDVQLVDNVLDLLLELAFRVDVEDASVQRRRVGVFGLGAVNCRGFGRPVPDTLKVDGMFVGL